MTLTEAELMGWISQYLWPFFRIGAFLYAIPLIGARSVPMRVRLMLAGAVTVIVAPLLPPMPAFQLMSIEAVQVIAQQLLTGFAMGFLVQMAFQIFTIAGQFIAMQNGLGFANMVDPTNGVSVTAVSQLYVVMVNLIFLSLQGHLAMIRMVVDSFTLLPVGTTGISPDGFDLLVKSASWMLASGVLLALPAVIALLVVNIAFGVMSKMAPQLNIISVGFPMNMVFGVVIIWATVGMVAPELSRATEYAFDLMKRMVSPNG